MMWDKGDQEICGTKANKNDVGQGRPKLMWVKKRSLSYTDKSSDKNVYLLFTIGSRSGYITFPFQIHL